MYNRTDQAAQVRVRVELALEKYRSDIQNCSAGMDVLRYAAQGLLKIVDGVDSNIFMDVYPQHPGYTILRLAKADKLIFKQE